MGKPARIALKRPALGQDEPFVGVDRQVVPQHVADLAEADPVAELAGVEQVAAQHCHAGQPLVGQFHPDRGKRVVDVPAIADEDLHPGRARLALRQALGVHRDLAPHGFRIEDGQITEHWANRDDLGMARQLGWIPSTPAYLFKMARAKRRAMRP